MRVADVAQRTRESVQRARLSADRITHDHETVSHEDHVVDLHEEDNEYNKVPCEYSSSSNLNNLLHEPGRVLQVVFLEVVVKAMLERVIVWFRKNNSRKQVANDSIEEGDIR